MQTNYKIQALINLGLSEREAKVYYALLPIKQGGALLVAELAGINRATTYHAISKFRGVKDYRALPVEHLKSYIRNQHRIIAQELPALQNQYNRRIKKQRLRVYHDLTSIKTLLEKSLRERTSLYVLGDVKLLSSYLGDYWEYFIKRSQQNGTPPQFKKAPREILLLLWSDKITYIAPSLFAYKNRSLHDVYQRLWNNY